MTVISPLENSPAKKAGLLAGDSILKIDDKITTDLSVDEAVNLIRGPQGSQVTLLISRDSFKEPKEFKITRDIINVPVYKYGIKEIDGKKIGYLQFYEFTETAASEFKKAVNQVLDSPVQGLVLDLRNNPGGYLEVATDVASWFLNQGDLVAVEDFGNGQKNEYKSYGYKKLASYPLIVLINQGSASASEILAGALRDDRNIKLVGEKSFGKGSVQELEDMPGGASLKVTVAKWLTPSGHSIMDQGLEPDVSVTMTQDDVDNNRDPQLDKALEMLK